MAKNQSPDFPAGCFTTRSPSSNDGASAASLGGMLGRLTPKRAINKASKAKRRLFILGMRGIVWVWEHSGGSVVRARVVWHGVATSCVVALEQPRISCSERISLDEVLTASCSCAELKQKRYERESVISIAAGKVAPFSNRQTNDVYDMLRLISLWP